MTVLSKLEQIPFHILKETPFNNSVYFVKVTIYNVLILSLAIGSDAEWEKIYIRNKCLLQFVIASQFVCSSYNMAEETNRQYNPVITLEEFVACVRMISWIFTFHPHIVLILFDKRFGEVDRVCYSDQIYTKSSLSFSFVSIQSSTIFKPFKKKNMTCTVSPSSNSLWTTYHTHHHYCTVFNIHLLFTLLRVLSRQSYVIGV